MSTPLDLSGTPEPVSLPASGTANSLGEDVRNRHLSISAVWTGTPTGTFSLQCSFDSGATWNTVPGAAAEFTANGNAQPAGAGGSAVWNFSHVPGGLWRILYTAVSGTGSLQLRRAWTD
jgi:hypothetical protein